MKNTILLSILICTTLLLVGCEKTTPQYQLQIISSKIDNSQYSIATIELKNFLKEAPQNATARSLLARVYMEQGLFIHAAKEWEKALSTGYDVNKGIIPLINSLYSTADYEQIILLWKKYNTSLSIKNKANAAAIVSLALLQSEDVNASKVLISKAVIWAKEDSPQSSISFISSLDKIYQRKLSISEQTNLLSKACENTPTNWVICSLSANTLYSNKQYERASAILEDLIISLPFYYQSSILLAEIYVKQGKVDDADFYISKLLKLFPEQPKVNQLKAIQLIKKEQYEKAIKHIDIAILNGYNTNDVKFIAGLTHYYLTNYEQALSYLNALKHNLPNNIFVNKLIIAAQLKLGNTTTVLTELNHIDLDKENIQMIAAAGIELLKSGAKNESKELLARIDSTVITNATLRANLGLTKLANGNISGVDDIEYLVNDLEARNTDMLNQNKGRYLFISSLISTNQLERAEDKIQEWISKEPNEDGNYLLLGEVIKLKQPFQRNKINDVYTQILKINPENLDANIYFAELALEKKDYNSAKLFYDKAMSLTQTNLKTVQGYFITSKQLGNEKVALNIIEEKLSDYKSNPQYGLLLAQINLLANKHSRTIKILNEITFTNKENKNTKNLILGDVLLQQGNYKSALKHFNLIEYPGIPNFNVLSKKLYIYERINKITDALLLLSKLNQRHPDNLMLGLLQAYYQALTNNPDDALVFINSLSNSQKEEHFTFKIKGMALHKLGKFSLALPYLKKTYIESKESRTASQLFDCLLKLSKENEAIDMVIKHLKQFPKDAATRFLYAGYLSTIDRLGAIEQLRKVIAVQDSNIVALNNIAWYLYKEGKTEQAVSYIETAKKIAPTSAFIIDTYKKITAGL
jgi:putative PEP-CTERM system TPR-repeat lipoprotein